MRLSTLPALISLSLAVCGAAPVDQPRTYLLSIGNIPLRGGESMESFSIKTWGVTFSAVCRIPPGWRIKAGGSATPNAEIEGQGSQGATWFNQSSPGELKRFVLVTLYAPVQRQDIGAPDKGIPATFKGSVTINTDDRDVLRPLTYRNVTLTLARRCPGQ